MASTSSIKQEDCDLKSSVFLISSNGRIIQLPIPSPSPRDPLNWSFRKRLSALGALFFFGFIGFVQIQGASLLIIKQAADQLHAGESQHKTHLELSMLVSSSWLFMGVGAFLWIPMSLAIGRRPVFLLCTFLLVASTLFAALSHGYRQHLAARCFLGLAVGYAPSAVILIIIDLTFIHQRAHTIAMFWSMCACASNAVISITPRITSTGMTWRDFYWIWITPCLMTVFLAFFLCPETYFRRPSVAFDGHIVSQSATEKITLYDGWEESDEEKPLPDLPPKSNFQTWISQLKFWRSSSGGGWRAMKPCYPQIILAMLNPLVFWVILLNALVYGAVLSIDQTSGDLLQAAPYNMSVENIALLRISCSIGSFFTWPAAGLMTTRISRFLTTRNKGVCDPEYYLPSFTLPVLVGGTGIFLYGVAAEKQLPLPWIYVSWGLVYFSFISLYTANTLWATQAFPRWAAASLVAVAGGSYIMSFALSFAIVPWIETSGFMWATGEIGLLIVLCGCVGIPIAIWGKRLREYIESRWGSNFAGALRPQ